MSGSAAPSPGAPAPGWLPRLLRRFVIWLLIIGVVGFLLDGANRPANPYLLVPGAHLPKAEAATLAGFPAATLSVSPAPGAPSPLRRACVLVAATPAQQQRGLMGVTSIGRYAGMVFVFAAPTTVEFYMKDTVIPLSIAWFDAAGRFVSATTMVPCHVSACPLYAARAPFRSALEVPAGELDRYGIGPGASIHVTPGC